MGVAVALLLNHVQLSADEAVWLPAGNLHAYLRGTGMEVLAASDNVLRGGFTAKRIDIDELIRVLRWDVLADPVVKPVTLAAGVLTWTAPAPEFSLLQVSPNGTAPIDIDAGGPRIVFCERGSVRVADGAGVPLSLAGGQAGFGRAGRRLRITGAGVVLVASTGL